MKPWQQVFATWRRALMQAEGSNGAPPWCHPEAIQGLFLERGPWGEPVCIHAAVADGYPLSMVSRPLACTEGRIPVRPMRRPLAQAQFATVEALGSSGTLGLWASDAFDPSAVFGVTAGHVLGANVLAAFDDPVRLDVAGHTVQGRLSEWSTLLATSGTRYELDAGLVRIPADDRAAVFDASRAHLPADIKAPPSAGDALSLLLADGSMISATAGIEAFGASVAFERIQADGSTDHVQLRIDRLQTCRLDQPSHPGDSGGALRDGTNDLVGIHCAFAPEAGPQEANAFYTRVTDIVAHFGVTPITLAQLSQPQAPRPRPALKRAQAPLPGADSPIPPSAGPETDEQAVDTLARTLWGEARGEGRTGMAAVACVVLNRVARGGWWGDTIVSVCRMPKQFSCWNAGTRSLQAVQAVTPADPAFGTAIEVARQAVDGRLADFTHGALHYHTVDVQPRWSLGVRPCFRLGRHVFFNNVL